MVAGRDLPLRRPAKLCREGRPERKRTTRFTNENRREIPAVINESAARQYFRDDDPLEQRILIGTGEGEPVTIVGVVGDTRFLGMDRDPIPEVYFPFGQVITGHMSVVVETEETIRGGIRLLREALEAIPEKQKQE